MELVVSGAESGQAWYERPTGELAGGFATDVRRGLSSDEAAARLERLGKNTLTPIKHERWWSEAVEALTEPLVLLLIAVAVLYAVLGELEDAITIFFVILAVAGVEVANETRAKRAITALHSLSALLATVVRSGEPSERAAEEIVPGDLVLLQPTNPV
jgi:Ca2+-transporting ATPase